METKPFELEVKDVFLIRTRGYGVGIETRGVDEPRQREELVEGCYVTDGVREWRVTGLERHCIPNAPVLSLCVSLSTEVLPKPGSILRVGRKEI